MNGFHARVEGIKYLGISLVREVKDFYKKKKLLHCLKTKTTKENVRK